MAGPIPLTDRQAKIDAVLAILRTRSEQTLQKMAELVVDSPDDQFFNQLEFDLRDLAHDFATDVQQAALDGDKKRATKVPASSVATASEMPDSSAIGPTR